jgi:mxaL protein
MLVLPLLLLGIAIFKPTLQMQRPLFNYVFVIDITQSMNARDYHVTDLPGDRLSVVKETIKYALQKLPCDSKVSLGLFTNKNVFMLFEPLEICQHYNVLEQSLMKIDWRMAWAADSHIARGIYTSIKEINRMEDKPRLVFFTDGQQTPVNIKEPLFLLKPGVVQGMIVGVGNLQPVPIPRLDNNNVPQGYWQIEETGDQSAYEAKQATSSGNYLSSVQEHELQRLATITGMEYRHLDTPEQLSLDLMLPEFSQPRQVATDVSWIFVVLALGCFLLPYFFRYSLLGYGSR